LRGAPAEPVLAAITGALKPHGQLVLVELVGQEAVSPDDTLIAWAQAECRKTDLPTEAAITRMLGRLGYEVRVVEDQSDRHAGLVLAGWNAVLRDLSQARPTPRQAAALVAEAERWLLRLRLMRQGRLRLLRWHAIRRASSP
jgi:hypothetical protein